MLVHVVLLTYRDDVPAITIAEATAAILGMRKYIKQIRSISMGSAVSFDRNKGHTHAVVVMLDSKADLEAYISHEVHRHVKSKYIVPFVSDMTVFDYETSETSLSLSNKAKVWKLLGAGALFVAVAAILKNIAK